MRLCLCNSCRGSFLFASLLAHLAHELAHGGDLARRAFLRPRFEALGGVFHVDQKILVLPRIAALLQSGPDALEDAEELATGFEEEVLMKKAVVEQSAGL